MYNWSYFILSMLWIAGCNIGKDFNWNIVSVERTSGNGIDRIYWYNDKFIAHSSSDRYYESTDGASWIQSSFGTGEAFVYGNNQYVAVGYDQITYEGRAYTSSDGINWTTIVIPFLALYDVIWDTTQYVAVGEEGTILISPNGINWSSVSTNITESLGQIMWANGRYFVLSGLSVYTSTDSKNWSKIDFKDSNVDKKYYGYIVWGKSGFVITGSPYSYYSADGVNWSKINTSFVPQSVTWCDGSLQYVSVKGNIEGSTEGTIYNWLDPPRIYTSSDGKTWYEHINRKHIGDNAKMIGFHTIACHGDKYIAGGNCLEFIGDSSCFMYSP